MSWAVVMVFHGANVIGLGNAADVARAGGAECPVLLSDSDIGIPTRLNAAYAGCPRPLRGRIRSGGRYFFDGTSPP